MENPFKTEPLVKGEIGGLHQRDVNDPAEKLLADAFRPVKTNEVQINEEKRPLLAEQLVPMTAMAAASAGTFGYGAAALGNSVGEMFTIGLKSSIPSSESLARNLASRALLRGAGTAAIMTAGTYGIDEMARKYDPNGEKWYSLAPTERNPYHSTIFAPTLVENVAYGLTGAISLAGKPRFGMLATGWLLGRVTNVIDNKFRR